MQLPLRCSYNSATGGCLPEREDGWVRATSISGAFLDTYSGIPIHKETGSAENLPTL